MQLLTTEIKAQLLKAMDAPFQERLDARLKGLGLDNDSDAERTMGPQVKDEIAHEINDPLTREFLKKQGLAHLLAPQW